MKKERTKKQKQKQMALQILKTEGKAGLEAFNKQQRAGSMPPATKTYHTRPKDVARGSSRKPKHKGHIFD